MTRNAPMWHSTDVSPPTVGQRVVWPEERGNYVAGTIRSGHDGQLGGWYRDPDEAKNETEPVRVSYVPSMWRPE